MSQEKSFTCVNCPMGCVIDVQLDDAGAITAIEGQSCRLGEDYVRQEAVDPRRNISTFIYVEGVLEPLSVKTAHPVPKGMIPQVVEAIRGIRAQPPIAVGDVVLPDAAGTGVPIVATKSIG